MSTINVYEMYGVDGAVDRNFGESGLLVSKDQLKSTGILLYVYVLPGAFLSNLNRTRLLSLRNCLFIFAPVAKSSKTFGGNDPNSK
jgi:hypothetical protein